MNVHLLEKRSRQGNILHRREEGRNSRGAISIQRDGGRMRKKFDKDFKNKKKKKG